MQSSTHPHHTQIIADYTRIKLADKTIKNLHQLIRNFEQERNTNKRIAIIGLSGLAFILGAVIIVKSIQHTVPNTIPANNNVTLNADHTHHITTI